MADNRFCPLYGSALAVQLIIMKIITSGQIPRKIFFIIATLGQIKGDFIGIIVMQPEVDEYKFKFFVMWKWFAFNCNTEQYFTKTHKSDKVWDVVQLLLPRGGGKITMLLFICQI